MPSAVAEVPPRMALTLVAMALYFGGFAISALFHPGWIAAACLVALQLAVYGGYLLATRDGLILRLAIFGLIVGFVELYGDAWAVREAGLSYPPAEPMIWASPLYMPFAYVPAMMQFGYLAWWAAQRWSLLSASLFLGAVGGASMPGYEYLAKSAGFWEYRGVPMLLDTTPYYIILAEVLLAVVLPFALRGLHVGSVTRAALIGVAIGVWFNITGPLSYWVTD
jgi:hypothetical protein